MTPDDMEGRLARIEDAIEQSEVFGFKTTNPAIADLRALLLDYQERGRALEQTAITLRMLKRNVETEINRHEGLHRWEGVPEAIQARIDDASATLKGKSHD
jgi:hypothetical protein